MEVFPAAYEWKGKLGSQLKSESSRAGERDVKNEAGAWSSARS